MNIISTCHTPGAIHAQQVLPMVSASATPDSLLRPGPFFKTEVLGKGFQPPRSSKFLVQLLNRHAIWDLRTTKVPTNLSPWWMTLAHHHG
jgi:hypothetical protein